MIWNGNYGVQAWLEGAVWRSVHDFAGSVVVHAVGGWLAFGAVICWGGAMAVTVRGVWWPSHRRIFPFLALGSWILIIGWFGFQRNECANPR